MRVLLLEPYCSGSHARWVSGLETYSQCDVSVLSLPGRHWKWRMHGGAVTLARLYHQNPQKFDLVFASDMLDLAAFRTLSGLSIPTGLYFHENQFSYPRSSRDSDIRSQRDQHYGFINYLSALAADRCFFNSAYHQRVFLSEARELLRRMRDFQELNTIEAISAKSEILPVGLDLKAFDAFRGQMNVEDGPPIIIWNHRWEHDKDPETFVRALTILQDRGRDFRLVVLGEHRGLKNDERAQRLQHFGSKVLHLGYAASREEYAAWLWNGAILPVTSKQDFFGLSAIEAMYCGCIPLLPNRLAFPEHVPQALQEKLLYSNFDDLVEKLDALVLTPRHPGKETLRKHLLRYDWSSVAPLYDAAWAGLTTLPGRGKVAIKQ